MKSKERGWFRNATAMAGILGAALLAASALTPVPAAAARHPARHVRHWALTDPSVIRESIAVDAATGRVLSETNADLYTHPASLTKMMTLYLTFQALNAGKLQIDQRLPVSAEAAGQKPTKLGLVAGDQVSVRSLILGIVTKSANDAAVVLAEGLGGSVPGFAAQMNAKAQQLGLTRTHYENPSGLPDPAQQTTARDQVRLALALIHDFPREYRYFATREFTFRGRVIHGHDHLLDWYEGADGIKTGYIRTSGFNLATSAVRDGHRLIGVVLGGRTAAARDQEMGRLLDAGFADLGVAPVMVAQHAAPPAAPVAAAPQPGAATPAAAVSPIAASAPTPRARPAVLTTAASRLVAHLSPVAKAEAAPVAQDPRAAADRWSVQLGAFRAQAAAEKVGREAAHLRIAEHKPMQIVHPGKGGKDRLYRARLLNFTAKDAREVCAALHKKHIDCTVVRPGTRVASR